MAGNRKGKHDVSPMVRGAFLNALEKIKKEQGKTFSDIIVDMLEEDPHKTLMAISRFAVREKEVTGEVKHDHKHDHVHKKLSETAQWLNEIVGSGEDRSPQKPLSH